MSDSHQDPHAVGRAVGSVLKAIGWLPIVIGAFVLLIGVINGAKGPVMCNGQQMGQNDICSITVNGSTEVVGYDEMSRRRESSLPDALAIGIPLMGGGAGLLVWGWWLSRRKV